MSRSTAEPAPGPMPTPPAIAPPKGGGAVRGLGESFSASPATGAGSFSVPLPLSPGRSGFGPQLTLGYDSGRGNGPFGYGWGLALASVTRRTDRGVPTYRDDDESDTFVLAGAEDLVPELDEAGGWERTPLIEPPHAPGYRIDRYRPRVEGLFARIERWTRLVDGDVHWRSITRDNVTSRYGIDDDSRIVDRPGHPGACRIFSWLIAEAYDPYGNAIVYRYKPENAAGVDLARAHERNRPPEARTANRYLKYVRYGNRTSRLIDPELADPDWMFELVLDYGEHDPDDPRPGDPGEWLCREDPFSTYRAGFEVRSYRLVQRLLMFHHFAGEPGVGQDCLVRSLDLAYRGAARRGDPAASFVESMTQRGYRRDPDGGYAGAAMPPLEFGYTEAVIAPEQRVVDPVSLENLPSGLDGSGYRWVDLDGEGIPGVLARRGTAWYYKAGLGDGRFGPMTPVATVPSGVRSGAAEPRLLDLAGDGQLDIVDFGGPTPGFAERTREGRWAAQVPFRSLPAVDFADPNLRLVDLDGDGLADILRTDGDGLAWYPSLGEAGFGRGEWLRHAGDEDGGPRLVVADGEDAIYLADMTGDGLTDLVRVRNGEVCYWPSLGHGRYGRKVSMDAAPRFDDTDRFEQRRIRLADIDGSGNTDLVYLGAGEISIWLNRSGNGWGERQVVNQLPSFDDLSDVEVIDLLGAGTACLVWSSRAPGDAHRPLCYVELMSGGKPHLLTTMRNNLGAETVVTYVPSTRFYLAGRAAGRPWRGRLPFPVHVVEWMESLDRVSGNRFVSRYAYHHGYFDGVEREFRGFGMVEQWDTVEFAAFAAGAPAGTNVEAASHVPPVLTRTWFHTGFHDDDAASRLAHAREYYGAPARGELPDPQPPQAPTEPTAAELREAGRALAGTLLRQEVYALDGSAAAAHPYTIVERAYQVRVVQPRRGNRHAVCYVHAREEISLQIDRMPVPDPRISHSFTLDVDDYGSVVRSVAVAYGRAGDDPETVLTAEDRARQRQNLLVLNDSSMTDPVLAGDGRTDAYRAPRPCETRTYELTWPGQAPGRRLTFEEVAGAVAAAVPLDIEEAPSPTGICMRLVERVRTRYRADDLSGLLPLGRLGALALPGEHERCAFTPGLLARAYSGRVDDTMLAAAGYVHSVGSDGTADPDWWSPTGRVYLSPAGAEELAYARQHFFLPLRFRDPFGNTTSVAYDRHDVLPARSTDRVGNVTAVTQDYRVLQAVVVTDPNGNRTAVGYDEFGLPVAIAVMGKADETDPARMGDTIDDPTARVEYARSEWLDHGRPTFVHTSTREAHRDPATRWHETYMFSDGFGRAIQTKASAEPGPLAPGRPPVAQRWLGTGWIVYNNKGQPVRRYEPFFSATSGFAVEAHGVASTTCVDPIGRTVAVLHPNHTYQKAVFEPWRRSMWDTNDTTGILDPKDDPDVGGIFARLPAREYLPSWYEQRRDGEFGPAARVAAERALAHTGTPATAYFDALGRPFLSVVDNGAGEYHATRVILDIQGRIRSTVDARGVEAMTGEYNMLGELVRTMSADAGTRRSLSNVAGDLAYGWNDRGTVRRAEYDAEQRLVGLHVDEGAGFRLAECTEYGEGQGSAGNFRGRVYRVCDGAGELASVAYDFKGNLLGSARRLLENYADPVDWSRDPDLTAPLLTGSTRYDALNRPLESMTHDGTAVRRTYDRAGRLADLRANLRGSPAQWTFLTGLSHNARGQRVEARLPIAPLDGGAGSIALEYAYDPLTFATTGRTAVRSTDGRRLQDLTYTYEPVGNLSAVADAAQRTVFYDNQQIAAGNDFVYDPVYRLVQATGREHDGSGSAASAWAPHYDPDDAVRRHRTHPNDATALRQYTETFRYDPAGNILRVTHRAEGGFGWTRRYEYADTSNRLLGTSLPGDGEDAHSARYGYDAHGNMTAMPHLPVLEWDHADRLSVTQRQVVTGGIAERTYYQYDGAGQRVRKVTVRANGSVKDERIYLGNLEYYRSYTGSGTLDVEREALHVMDSGHRVALVETTIRDRGASVPVPEPLIRYQLGNHLGSAALELDRAGEIISYEEYYPYGSTAYQAGRSLAEVGLKRYRYSGKERDEETGLNYHDARYYAPWLGRWTSADPAGMVEGPNLYQMTLGNPANHTDPTGLGTPGEVPGGLETTSISPQTGGVLPPGTVKEFGVWVTDPATGLRFEQYLDYAAPPANEFMNELMCVECKGLPNSRRTPGQKIAHPMFEKGAWVEVMKDQPSLGLKAGDKIFLKTGQNFVIIDKSNLAGFKEGATAVYEGRPQIARINAAGKWEFQTFESKQALAEFLAKQGSPSAVKAVGKPPPLLTGLPASNSPGPQAGNAAVVVLDLMKEPVLDFVLGGLRIDLERRANHTDFVMDDEDWAKLARQRAEKLQSKMDELQAERDGVSVESVRASRDMCRVPGPEGPQLDAQVDPGAIPLWKAEMLIRPQRDPFWERFDRGGPP